MTTITPPTSPSATTPDAPYGVSPPVPSTNGCEHANLDLAILAAQRDIDSVRKDSRNDHHGFAYASADSIVADCRKVLNRHGLTVYGLGAPTQVIDATRATTGMTFIVKHAATGQELKAERGMIAETGKGRPMDKAILGAQTSLWGYFLRDLLALPRFTEEEISARNYDAYDDPQTLGRKATFGWLLPRCSELEIAPEYLRSQMVKAGVPADSIAGKPHTWPADLRPRLEKFLEAYRARYGVRNGPGAAAPSQDIRTLPQREDAPKPQPKPTTARPAKALPGGGVDITVEDIPF